MIPPAALSQRRCAGPYDLSTGTGERPPTATAPVRMHRWSVVLIGLAGKQEIRITVTAETRGMARLVAAERLDCEPESVLVAYLSTIQPTKGK